MMCKTSDGLGTDKERMKKLTITYRTQSGDYNYNGDPKYVSRDIIIPIHQEDGMNVIRMPDETLNDLVTVLSRNYVQCMLTHKD
jgi:hypothetical protein